MARAAGITLDDIISAAVDLADREGIAAATPTAVAGALGVRTPSLYHHVDGATGLRRALALSAARELKGRFEAATAGRSGADALRAVAYAYRGFATEHPGWHGCLVPAPRPGEDDELTAALAEPVAVVAGALGADGPLDDDAVHAIRAFRALVFGFVTLETQGGFGIPVDIDDSFRVAADLIIDSIAPS